MGSANKIVNEYLDLVMSKYEQAIEDHISSITPAPAIPSPRKSPIKSSLKRSRVSEVAPSPSAAKAKAAKNARLKRAMEEVNRTIGQMGNGDLGNDTSLIVS